jgi:hypothetical protein
VENHIKEDKKMSHSDDELGEFDEMPEEYRQEELEKLAEAQAMEAPDVEWKEHIENIEDPEIKRKEIEFAEKIIEKEEDLKNRFESGEISEIDFWAENMFGIGREKVRAATRCELGSEGITYDDIGDMAEDWDFFIAEAGGNPKPAKMKNRVKEMINRQGPEASQELADKMLEDEEISKEAHDTISRQVRLYGK